MPDAPDALARRARTETKFDDRGREYESDQLNIAQVGHPSQMPGSVLSDKLVTKVFYNG
jgi:hypothetical protein